jgi:aldehyde dehydrogenase (NAD+)
MTSSLLEPQFVEVESEEIDRLHAALSGRREQVAARSVQDRIALLRRLEEVMFARREEIRAAMWADYRKPAAEVDLSEIYPVVSEARHARRRLRNWLRPRKVRTPLSLLGSSSYVVHEPKGVVLIIAPWNFPFNLLLGPLVSAIAAGNCVMLKPSELTPESAKCIRRIVSDVFDESEVALVEGGPEVAKKLLQKRFDHIFFTGSPEVGRAVMQAAAGNLTSITLELGGKSPAIVDATADVGEAARKIAWGKFFNCGQICIAPDYVLVDRKVSAEFLSRLRSSIQALGSPARGLIVNDRHAERVQRLIDSAVAGGAVVAVGGASIGRELAPTVLTDVPADARILREEIFGPVLPIVEYATLDDAYRIIEAREKPLVLYVFSRTRSVAREIIRRTRAGGTAINHTLIHFFQLELPFGGAGSSGMGRAHGFHGFEAFSNVRGVLDQRSRFAAIDLLYPPYGSRLKKLIIEVLLRWF